MPFLIPAAIIAALLLVGIFFAGTSSQTAPANNSAPLSDATTTAATPTAPAVVPTPNQSAGTPSARAPTPPAPPTRPSPYLFSRADAEAGLSKKTVTVTVGGAIPLPHEPGATLHFTNIGNVSGAEVARFEIRNGSDVERFELPAGGVALSRSAGAYRNALSVHTIIDDSDTASLSLYSFPTTLSTVSLPATLWTYLRQALTYQSSGGARITIVPLSILERKVQLGISEYAGEILTRNGSVWLGEGEQTDLPKAFSIDVLKIHSAIDPAFISANAKWRPDLVVLSVKEK